MNLRLTLATLMIPTLGLQAASVPPFIDKVHSDIWERFVLKPQMLLLDYANLDGTIGLPDAEDCRLGRPNALAWWTPLENGPFFNGLYMDGMLARWKMTSAEADREKASQLMEGLMLCASVGDTPGFIARGVLADKTSHYPIGSDDQTAPWFYGLWRYLKTGAADEGERERIIEKMVEVGSALEANRWLMPCSNAGELLPNQHRGGWTGAEYRGATRLLFVTRILHELTGDSHWLDAYQNALTEVMPDGRSRLQLVEAGMPGEWQHLPDLSKGQLWIYLISQAMVNELIALESNPDTQSAYATSLKLTAIAAAESITSTLSPELATAVFKTDWESMNPLWKPQATPDEAVQLALEQLRFWQNRGREVEIANLREPACAAWIAFFDPETARKHAPKFLEFLANVNWNQAVSSAGFLAESAWYQLQQAAPTEAMAAPRPAQRSGGSEAVTATVLDESAMRCTSQFTFVEIPEALRGKQLFTVPRGANSAPGQGFSVAVENDSVAWLLVMDKGEVTLDPEWIPVDLTTHWDSGAGEFKDRIFERKVSAGEKIVVPAASAMDPSGIYSIPHALVVGAAQ